MRKTLTLISLGLAGWILAGCEQQQDGLEPTDDLGSPPATEPDVQIGRGDPIDGPEPASPGSVEREIEPTIIEEDDPNTDSLDPAQDPFEPEPEQDPLTPPPQN